MRRLTIFDYGAGNLHSLAKALQLPGAEVRVEADPRRALDADLLVLPGVGAFQAAAARLAPALADVRSALADGLPCLGICLGMQLLFARSEEGPGAGLGVLAGEVTRLRAVRVPHIGWNELEEARGAMFERAPLATAYYANGFVCRAEDLADVAAWTTHERDRFPAAVRRGAVVGVQFHPEKSSAPGVRFLRAVAGELAGVAIDLEAPLEAAPGEVADVAVAPARPAAEREERPPAYTNGRHAPGGRP